MDEHADPVPRLRGEPVVVPRGYFIAFPNDDAAAPGLFDVALDALRRSWLLVAGCTLFFGTLALAASFFMAMKSWIIVVELERERVGRNRRHPPLTPSGLE